MKEIYLDANATAPMTESVARVLEQAQHECWGNPSSAHPVGERAAEALERARRSLLKSLGGNADWDLVFTPGGTYSINLAFTAAPTPERLASALITSVEHRAVLEAMERLAERTGLLGDRTAVDSFGVPVWQDLVRRLNDQHVPFVSLIWANNETGTVTNLDALREALSLVSYGPPPIVHLDACQGIGRLPFSLGECPAHLVSLTSHKIGGPKGIGALAFRRGVALNPIVAGAGQEHGLVPGTEDVARAVAMAEAVDQAVRGIGERTEGLRDRRKRLWKLIQEIAPHSLRNSPGNKLDHPAYLPNTLNVTFRGIKAASLVGEMARRGVCISTGSACSTKPGVLPGSHVILAVTGSVELAESSVRFSFLDHEPGDVWTETRWADLRERLQAALAACRSEA